MGRLIEFILFAVVAYFVFKFLNRLFSPTPSNNKKTSQSFQSTERKSPDNYSKKDIKWDAETVDYEEVDTNNNNEKK
ncbi:hypothetical protein O2K51_08150 [Apibacter raozihei]|uniref:hypothetical protein n=1 Tax=Apibacter raozihei TaxID=2500547 RepID=UPI000FE3226C|nr:hypothetical protein [Apibacter raozihei]